MFIIVLTIGIILLSIGYCGHNKHEFHISYIYLATIAMFFFLIVNTIWVWLMGIMNQPTVGKPINQVCGRILVGLNISCAKKMFYDACWGDTDNLRRI